MATVSYCRCGAREAAQRDGVFKWSFVHGAWIFPDGVRRTMSAKAAFYAFTMRDDVKHPDHRGEHYRYVTCPWCGGDLPHVSMAPPTDWLGDPED